MRILVKIYFLIIFAIISHYRRIIGTVHLGQKSIVYLQDQTNVPFCYAVLVTPNFLLTAATCSIQRKSKFYLIQTYEKVILPVEYVFVHSEYDPTDEDYDIDLAGVKLREPIDLNVLDLELLSYAKENSSVNTLPSSCIITNGVKEEAYENNFEQCKEWVESDLKYDVLCLHRRNSKRALTSNCHFLSGAPILCNGNFVGVTPKFDCRNPSELITAITLRHELHWLQSLEERFNYSLIHSDVHDVQGSKGIIPESERDDVELIQVSSGFMINYFLYILSLSYGIIHINIFQLY